MTAGDSAFRIAELEDKATHQTLALASALISLIDLRDRYTGGHSSRVAAYCREIAVHLGLPHEATEEVVLAASLHDIGKIGVPDSVLLKEGELDSSEFEWIRKHPEFGWAALRNMDGFQRASLLVLHHHERWEGGGYPGNLRGTEIPLGSRIISVAVSFDALTTDRPYRKARSWPEAMREIVRCSGTHFDSQVVIAFCQSMERKAVRPAAAYAFCSSAESSVSSSSRSSSHSGRGWGPG